MNAKEKAEILRKAGYIDIKTPSDYQWYWNNTVVSWTDDMQSRQHTTEEAYQHYLNSQATQAPAAPQAETINERDWQADYHELIKSIGNGTSAYEKVIAEKNADLAAAQARIAQLEAELAQAMEIIRTLESLDLLSMAITELREVEDIEGYIDIHVFREEKLKGKPQQAQAVTLASEVTLTADMVTIGDEESEWLAWHMDSKGFIVRTKLSSVPERFQHLVSFDHDYYGLAKYRLAPKYDTALNRAVIKRYMDDLGLL